MSAIEAWIESQRPSILSEPVLTIDPRRGFGTVCIAGRTLRADVVAEAVLAEHSDTTFVADMYAITRDQVLVACWWYYDTLGRSKRDRTVSEAWSEWQDIAGSILAGHRPGPCPDPPEVP